MSNVSFFDIEPDTTYWSQNFLVKATEIDKLNALPLKHEHLRLAAVNIFLLGLILTRVKLRFYPYLLMTLPDPVRDPESL